MIGCDCFSSLFVQQDQDCEIVNSHGLQFCRLADGSGWLSREACIKILDHLYAVILWSLSTSPALPSGLGTRARDLVLEPYYLMVLEVDPAGSLANLHRCGHVRDVLAYIARQHARYHSRGGSPVRAPHCRYSLRPSVKAPERF